MSPVLVSCESCHTARNAARAGSAPSSLAMIDAISEVRQECSATLSGSRTPAIHHPVRLDCLSVPASYRNRATWVSSFTASASRQLLAIQHHWQPVAQGSGRGRLFCRVPHPCEEPAQVGGRSGSAHPTSLGRGQYAGWNCVWCNASLRDGGISVGVSRGGVGAYDLDVEVYACQPCTALRRPQGVDQ